VFENEQFSITLFGNREGVMIDIENKTDATWLLVWDESAVSVGNSRFLPLYF
jgi:hypothetical protein